MTWGEILALGQSSEAKHAIERWVASISTAEEAAEIIGGRAAREITEDWKTPVKSRVLITWRDRVIGLAFLRWESTKRERLIADAVREASTHLELTAKAAGVRLHRPARLVLADATKADRWLERAIVGDPL
jgi:hypothetical protein